MVRLTDREDNEQKTIRLRLATWNTSNAQNKETTWTGIWFAIFIQTHTRLGKELLYKDSAQRIHGILFQKMWWSVKAQQWDVWSKQFWIWFSLTAPMTISTSWKLTEQCWSKKNMTHTKMAYITMISGICSTQYSTNMQSRRVLSPMEAGLSSKFSHHSPPFQSSVNEIQSRPQDSESLTSTEHCMLKP